MSEPYMKVFYVEDDPDIREVVELAFELEADMRLISCDPGTAVLELMRGHKPDLVLLDVMMPGIDGIALAKQMKADAQLAATPFAFMTAKAMPQELKQLRELGAIGIISKPFNPLTLTSDVRALMNYASCKDQLTVTRSGSG